MLDDFRWTGDSDDLVVWHEYERGHQRTAGHLPRGLPLGRLAQHCPDTGLLSVVLDRAEHGGLEAVNELRALLLRGRAQPPRHAAAPG